MVSHPEDKPADVLAPRVPKGRGALEKLDRRVFAWARSRGMSKAESSRRAGSSATSSAALTICGTRLERDPSVQRLIRVLRAHADSVVTLVDRGLEEAAQMMLDWLHSDDVEKQKEAARWFRLLAPRRLEITGAGGGPVRTEALVIPNAEWLAQFRASLEQVTLPGVVDVQARELPVGGDDAGE